MQRQLQQLKSNDILDLLDEDEINIGDDHENISQEYDEAVIVGTQKIDTLIGYGKSGSIICKGIHKDSRQEVAIKIIEKAQMTQAQIEDVRDMINILQQSQHHNIVHLEDFFENKDHIYLCLELHSKMTLFDFVNKYNQDIQECRVQEIANKIG